MKTTSPAALVRAYALLFPEERLERDLADAERIFGNWLARYQAAPERAIATQNWAGKVTRALFWALDLRQPRTKREMLQALEVEASENS